MARIVSINEWEETQVLTVDDIQWAQIRAAAALVPDLALFIRSVINMIYARCAPTAVDVQEIIEFVLSARGVSYRARGGAGARIHFNNTRPRISS